MLILSNPPRLCLSVLLFLLHLSPVLSMTCEDFPFVPGHDLAGNGFDVVTLKTRAGVFDLATAVEDDCNRANNPLLNREQKVHTTVRWDVFSPCNMEHSHTEHTSVSSLISQYSNEGSIGWQTDLNPFPHDLDIVGTGSDVYTFAADLSQDDYLFSSHRVTCTYYRHSLVDIPNPSSQFSAAVDSLPDSFSSATKANYRQFIDTFGTHYTSIVDLGGQLNEVTAESICASALNGLSPQQLHFCSKLGFSLGLGKANTENIEACNNVPQNQVSTVLNRYIEVIGGVGWSGEFSHVEEDSQGYTDWLKTLVASPDVVKHTLAPLHLLLASTPLKQAALKAAIEDYLNENAISPLTQAGDGGLINCCPPQQAPQGHVEVTITSGWLEQGNPETYVVLTFNDESHSTHVIKSKDPVWNAVFDLGTVDTHQTFTVQVWKKNNVPDDILVSCTFDVHQGTHTETCSSEKGKVYFEYTLTCDDGVTGDKCNE